MADLILYTNPMSRGRIARWMLEEVGQPYQTALVEWDKEKPTALLAANPLGKVPTIVHGDKVVSEGAAVCAYLADAFPDAGLAPPPAERHDYYRWLFFTSGPLEAALMDKFLGADVPADKRATVGYGSHDEAIDTLEFALTGKTYVAADRFTAADVYVGSLIGYFTQFGMLPKRPVFMDYLARVTDRPAARRPREIDDAEMAKMMPPSNGGAQA